MKKLAKLILFALLLSVLSVGVFGCTPTYTLPDGASYSINVFTRFSSAAGNAVSFEVLEIYEREGSPEARVRITYEKTLSSSATEADTEAALREKIKSENISAVTEKSYNENVRLFEVESLRFESRANGQTVMVTAIRYEALTMLSSTYYRLVRASSFTDTSVGNQFRDQEGNTIRVIGVEAENLYVLTLRYYSDSAAYHFDDCTISGYYSQDAVLETFTDNSISFEDLSGYLYLAVTQTGFPWATVSVIAAACAAVAFLVVFVLKLTSPSRKKG